MINTRLFHPRIINKYLDTAQYLKNGAIPLKPQQTIEKCLSNQAAHKKRNEQAIREEFSIFFKDLLGYKALMAFYNPFRKGFKAECGYGDCFNF